MPLPNTSRSPHKIFGKASRLHQEGKIEEAIGLLQELANAHPKHIDGVFMLGSLLAQRHRLDEARHYLDRAAELNPRSVQTQNNLGNVHRMQGDDESALKCYYRAVRIDPAFAPAWLNLGFINAGLKRWKEAIDAFAYVGGEQSNDPDVLCALGGAHAATGNVASAIGCYERALPLDADGRRNTAIILAALRGGDIPERHPDGLVIETYRKKADRWDADVRRSNDSYFGPDHVLHLLSSHLDALAPCSLDILDLGCGTGACGEFLAPAAHLLTGVDLSPDMLAIARRRDIYTQLVEAEIGDYLENSRQCYDLIVAAGVLIMFSKLDVIFGRIARRMAPGGLFAFTLYRSTGAPIEIRHNYHFGHSRSYVEHEVAVAGLEILELLEVIHETDVGIEQPGFSILLRRIGAKDCATVEAPQS